MPRLWMIGRHRALQGAATAAPAGRPDDTMDKPRALAHIVPLVEAKAERIQAETPKEPLKAAE